MSSGSCGSTGLTSTPRESDNAVGNLTNLLARVRLWVTRVRFDLIKWRRLHTREAPLYADATARNWSSLMTCAALQLVSSGHCLRANLNRHVHSPFQNPAMQVRCRDIGVRLS